MTCASVMPSIGTVEFEVTQPRFPCFKLGIRFGRDDILMRFLESGRSGFYLSVVKEGSIAAGDAIRFEPRAEHDVTITMSPPRMRQEARTAICFGGFSMSRHCRAGFASILRGV